MMWNDFYVLFMFVLLPSLLPHSAGIAVNRKSDAAGTPDNYLPINYSFTNANQKQIRTIGGPRMINFY